MPIKKNYRAALPCALTIAGSDSGGGAGIQADLKTFAALGVHGTCAITCITAQNPRQVRAVSSVEPEMVAAQIEAVLAELPPQAIKTGMLFSSEIIRMVANTLRGTKSPLIVDPVVISSSGAALLREDGLADLKEFIISRADLITPNLDEAALLLGTEIKNPEDLRSAAREFHARYGCAALVKGGHLRPSRQAIDFYFDGKVELMMEAPRVRGISTHGTGCTYSAAIAAECALGRTLAEAVIAGKEFISNAIAASQRSGRHSVLNSFWGRR